MLAVDRGDHAFLYQQVVELIVAQVQNGTLRPGDRLPSLRGLSSRLAISVPTVRQAYLELERQGRIEARPKSGYFVCPRVPALIVMGSADPDFEDAAGEARDLARRLRAEMLLVDGAGHYPHAEMPEVVGARIAEFLARLRRS